MKTTTDRWLTTGEVCGRCGRRHRYIHTVGACARRTTTTTTTTIYTTRGDVRGECGHRHRTIAGAQKCADRDGAWCAAQGGYSDRVVVRADGEPLSEEEEYALEGTDAGW